MDAILILVIELFIAAVIGLLIINKPYLGIVFIVSVQPVIDLLPRLPLVSSAVVLLGGLTILAFLLKAKREAIRGAFQFSGLHLAWLLFLIWILLTNPAAAWSGVERNWVFTYLQLGILLWLSGFLIDTPEKHRMLMWVFSLATIVTAVVAIQRGGFLEEINLDYRAAGLSTGANTAARYFIIAFIFLNYLLTVTRTGTLKVVAAIGMVLTFLGVFYTVSRTGMLLLGIAILLLVLFQPNSRYRVQFSIIVLIGLGLILVFSANILPFAQNIIPSIIRGSDTVGLRYALWKAGLQMWNDHKLAGVGIGLFPMNLMLYPNATYFMLFQRGLVAHNMFVSILAETGAVGIILFVSQLVITIVQFFKARRHLAEEFRSILDRWLMVFIIMVLGGITKTDQTDKLLWVVMGISVFFSMAVKQSRQLIMAKNEERPPVELAGSLDK